MESVPLVAAAAVLAAVVAIGCAAVRVVPAGHCGVVTRAGRVNRARPSGLALLLPGAERIAMVAVHPAPIGPLAVTALTRDGVEVRVVVSALWWVADPMRAVQAVRDARATTAAAVERTLRHLVATVELANLLRDREAAMSPLPALSLPLLGPFGVQLIDIDLLDLEVRVGPQLLRLLA